MKGLNPPKVAGINNLFSKFLKEGVDILARPILNFIDSLWASRFLEVAKVKPLLKKGSNTDPQNYHPIWLLPILSKIIESIIPDQTREFLS